MKRLTENYSAIADIQLHRKRRRFRAVKQSSNVSTKVGAIQTSRSRQLEYKRLIISYTPVLH